MWERCPENRTELSCSPSHVNDTQTDDFTCTCNLHLGRSLHSTFPCPAACVILAGQCFKSILSNKLGLVWWKPDGLRLMFLIPSYMALMALGQRGEQPCPMVLFSDQMCHPVPHFTSDLVWYQVILWRDLCFTPQFSSGSCEDQHGRSNRPSCAWLM